jgi:hypothetical protein
MRRRRVLDIPRQRLTEDCQIYFVQFGADGPIKIGRARNVAARLVSLQTASPVELVLLGVVPGSVEKERVLHSLFRPLRVRGEWFRPEAELLEFIAEQLSYQTPAV